jgi:hypothetical protein
MTGGLPGGATQEASRGANERFHTVLVERPALDGLIPFLCECADADCLGRVEMSLADYGQVHLDREVYVIMRGHPTIDGELPIEERERFDVVRKAAGGA